MSFDIVYVVGDSEQNEELRYSLRSLKNLPHGTVWIAGHKPKWAVNVEHLPVRQIQPTKYQNSTANLLAALTHPDVAENVVYMNDDFFILEPVESVPYLHLGPVNGRVEYYDGKYGHRPKGVGRYRDGMVQTASLLEKWGYRNVLSYEAHVPMPLHKETMAAAIRRASEEASIVALHKRTLYGNLCGVGGSKITDVKVLTSTHTWADGQPFVSTSNQTWQSGAVGRRLRKLFPEPSRYERS